MATRSANSNSSVLVLILLILTFPFWFAAGAALFGIIIGLCGAAFGIIVALFAVAVAIIALPFKILFGWNDFVWHGFDGDDWGWQWYLGPHINTYVLVAIIIVIFLVLKSRGRLK